MSEDVRRVLLAMVVAMAAFIAYRYIVELLYPTQPPPPAATQPASPTPASRPLTTGPTTAPETRPAEDTQPAPTTDRTYHIAAAETSGPIELGGGAQDALRVTLRPLGASVASIQLIETDTKGRYLFRTAVDKETPYEVLAPVDTSTRSYYSFGTHRLWVEEFGNQSFTVGDEPWELVAHDAAHAVFRTLLESSAGEPILELTKTYTLHPGKPVMDLELGVTNRSGRPLTVWVDQDGPIGVRAEQTQYDMRRLLSVQFTDGQPQLGKGYQHAALQKATRADAPIRLDNPDGGPLLWTALVNKYFGVYTRPRPAGGADFQEYIRTVYGSVAVPNATENLGDLRARFTTRSAELKPEEQARYTFEIYAGAKDSDHLRAANPDYADPQKLYYQAAQSADQHCCCTFEWLRELMVWLLGVIYAGVRNYGIAIIVLVVIIRTLLHPLTVFQQKSMFKMQEAMARVQPRMQEIKEKYANDKVKQNQEMMRVWGEEGVNPLGSFVGFLPLMIQMPILVALWTALNTDVHLRHAPFDGWWIDDLSAPDALISFAPVHIPLLSWFMGPIDSLNLLPLLMGVSMWLQQKYMPKPHLQAKLDAAKQNPPKKSATGMTPEEQMRQQQMMMYMMSIIFPLMFYKMPSGLNLYWMATNVFGICESLIIRRQIEKEKEKRKRAGPPPPRSNQPGFFGRFLKRIATQAEELQKKADELSDQTKGVRTKRKGDALPEPNKGKKKKS